MNKKFLLQTVSEMLEFWEVASQNGIECINCDLHTSHCAYTKEKLTPDRQFIYCHINKNIVGTVETSPPAKIQRKEVTNWNIRLKSGKAVQIINVAQKAPQGFRELIVRKDVISESVYWRGTFTVYRLRQNSSCSI